MKLALRTKVLAGVALAIGAYITFSPSDTTVEVAKNSERAPAAARVRTPKPTAQGGGAARAPHASTTAGGATQALALFAHRVADATEAASLFAAHSWYVAPPPPPAPPVSAVPQPPPKPTAPPLPYQFMGSYAPDGGALVVFLTRGDVVFNVHLGDTLENTYSVDKLEGGQLYLTYKPLNIQQQLNAGGSQ